MNLADLLPSIVLTFGEQSSFFKSIFRGCLKLQPEMCETVPLSAKELKVSWLPGSLFSWGILCCGAWMYNPVDRWPESRVSEPEGIHAARASAWQAGNPGLLRKCCLGLSRMTDDEQKLACQLLIKHDNCWDSVLCYWNCQCSMMMSLLYSVFQIYLGTMFEATILAMFSCQWGV